MSDDAANPDLPVAIGDVLAGKYRVDRVLGVGGMGVVVQATHLQLDQKVALKFLLPQAMQSHEAVERFQREARAAVRLKSLHAAKVADVGVLETGAPYMVMEYLDGADLSHVMHNLGTMEPGDAVNYVLQACEAIAEAHSIGIIHRDLKPQNLFVTRHVDGTALVKVLDFGISKSIDTQSGLSLTRTSSIMGSPLYMSPEQMRSSKNVDQRSDIWGLGVILYELLTGRVPFEAEAIPELCLKVVQDAAEPPRSLRPEVSEGLNAVVLKCLEKDPGQRFQNVAELAAALEPYAPDASRGATDRIAATLQVPSRPPMVSIVTDTSRNAKVGTGGTAWGATQAFPENKKRTTLLAAAGALGVLLLVGGFFAIRGVAFSPADPAAGASAAPPGSAAPTAPTVTAVIATPPPQPTPSVPSAKPSATEAATATAKPPPRPATHPTVKHVTPHPKATATAKTVNPAPTVTAPPKTFE